MGVQEWISKRGVVIDLNRIALGRVVEAKDTGYAKTTFTYREDLWGRRKHRYGAVPISHVLSLSNVTQFPEGVVIIFPFEYDSPGHFHFNRVPVIQLSSLKRTILEYELQIRAKMHRNLEYMSASELRELIEDITKIMSGMRKTAETQEIPTFAIPTGEEGKEK